MIKEKISQAISILNEEDVDMWMIFGRESGTIPDPAADLVVGVHYTWHSAFMIFKDGDTVAIVGSLDAAELEKKGYYKRIIPYVGGIKEKLIEVLNEKNPSKIAVNYSEDDIMADGLTHGMYLYLKKILSDTPYFERFVKSEKIVSKLRGRKSPTEIERIKHAISETEKIFDEVTKFLKPGITERDVWEFVLDIVDKKGYETAWEREMCPSVFTGEPTEGEAHTGPTHKKVEKGDVLNIDFGLKINGYCSDLQRTWYILRDDEEDAPKIVKKGFKAVVDAIELAAKAIRPGMCGWEVDKIARDHIVSQGFDEFPHGLGHQVGRSPHDGATLLCPRWERYGNLPYLKIEEGQVFTLEPRVRIKGYGTATVEDIIVVTKNGGKFLSSFQRKLWLIK